MKSPLRRCGIAVLASVFVFTFGMEAKAQVLEAPQIYQLPPFDPESFDENGAPNTLDTGSLTGLTSSIGNVLLNDIAIGGIPNQEVTPPPPPPPPAGIDTLTGRFWSLVHTSTTDTRALAVATPVDVVMDFSDSEECYDFIQSLQILDLNNDDINDVAFLGPCFTNAGFPQQQNVMGLQGNSSDPFQQANTLTFLGNQAGGTLLNLDAGQLGMVAADFDGDAVLDLGYYIFNTENEAFHALEVLLNNGTLGLLPNEITLIQPPANDNIRGSEVAAGDFDGDGTVDMAVVFEVSTDAGDENELRVYSGNGDGTFDVEPIVQADLNADDTVEFEPQSLTAGNFDSNNFSDFAVTWEDDQTGDNFLAVVLCSSSGCTNTNLPFAQGIGGGILVAADFDNDGADDIANDVHTERVAAGVGDEDSSVQVHLNDGNGQFSITPDQTLTLDVTGFTDTFITQVVTDDIDACGGPDLAFTGAVFLQPTGITFGDGEFFEYQGAVAFNPNEAPTANAGEDNGVSSGSGIQIGGGLFPGNPPTCTDPTNDVMEISWTQISGSPATISDTSAANPIVSRSTGTGDAVFQVTCTDPCGLSDSDTVTITQSGFLQGGGISCGLNPMAAGSAINLTGGMILGLTGFLAAWRKMKS